MRRILRHRLVIGGVALAFAAFGGAAYAASQSGSRPRASLLNDVAKRLNVSPQRLSSAIKGALIDRLNAAVKDRRLTRAQAKAIEHRIEQNGGPPFLFGPGPGAFAHPPGHLGGPPPVGDARPLAAAASYLGLTEMQLFNELRSGHSLAQIAKARGKSVSGLQRAITATVKSRLDQAVSAGRVTKAQEQHLLSMLSSRLRDLIIRTPPAFAPWRGGPPGRWVHPSPIPPF